MKNVNIDDFLVDYIPEGENIYVPANWLQNELREKQKLQNAQNQKDQEIERLKLLCQTFKDRIQMLEFCRTLKTRQDKVLVV